MDQTASPVDQSWISVTPGWLSAAEPLAESARRSFVRWAIESKERCWTLND